ncbi:MAG: hypothetical protein D3910_14780, partial [Candidatus Electrothrix sp. ATG2]|nr:hypothetical protein [Candidatus Electrothrix sp. ATG2]
NLGTDAFWSGSDLWVLQADILLLLTANSFLDGSFENMEALQKAHEEQNRSFAIHATKIILEKLKQAKLAP